jgi:pimeloyl-ACP methyl ester carboxylesterase
MFPANNYLLRIACMVMLALLLTSCAGHSQANKNRVMPGPYEVVKSAAITLQDPVQDRQVVLRVAWPDSYGETFPVVVFSHGAFCYPQQYANVTDFWVSHGYVVIFPDHLDSPNGPKMKFMDSRKMLSSRVRDMSFVLDSLAEIEQAEPRLAGRMDGSRTAVAGHSFGGMIAMIKTGLKMQEQRTAVPVEMADERFQAAVVMSGVGPMEPMTMFPEVPTMAPDAFSGLTKPLIANGGTLDEGNVGTGKIYPWRWRMAPYILAPAGDKYSMVLDNTDHYMGGLICRDNRGGRDDPRAVAVVRAAQTAFLDAYVKDDQSALSWLQTYDFSQLSAGRATFTFK